MHENTEAVGERVVESLLSICEALGSLAALTHPHSTKTQVQHDSIHAHLRAAVLG